ncbi:hypothetical protein [Chryseobacterium sp. SG20098]|uniref:hypothetical protein n=1 Tax=Chryseobacterium sp. SG20098 TaxID=3074145 RepID=UPI0028834D92|nr:hypothetical protein [Chryseobacterium sp. SG20098]WNI38551.1 hypothetical protein RHP76_08660 [Chryseobacterium sp. SG20098]
MIKGLKPIPIELYSTAMPKYSGYLDVKDLNTSVITKNKSEARSLNPNLVTRNSNASCPYSKDIF